MAAPLYLNVGTRSQSAGAVTLTPALPASRSNGNILIATLASKNNATHATATGGWVLVGTQTNSGASFTRSRWWRIVDGTEASPVFTWTGSVACFAQIEQYDRDNTDTAAPFGTIGTAAPGTVATHTSTGFNTTRDLSLVIYSDACAANTAVGTPAGWVENYDNGNATGATNNAGGSKAVATSGTGSGNISVTGGAAAWVQQQVELKAPTIASGFICAGEVTSPSTLTGYMSSGVATVFSTTPFGTIGGISTAFGTVEGLWSSSGSGSLAISSPVGMPTAITIAGVSYPLTFSTTLSGYDLYSIDAAFTGFTDTITYTWLFPNSVNSGFFLLF